MAKKSGEALWSSCWLDTGIGGIARPSQWDKSTVLHKFYRLRTKGKKTRQAFNCWPSHLPWSWHRLRGCPWVSLVFGRLPILVCSKPTSLVPMKRLPPWVASWNQCIVEPSRTSTHQHLFELDPDVNLRLAQDLEAVLRTYSPCRKFQNHQAVPLLLPTIWCSDRPFPTQYSACDCPELFIFRSF